MLGLYLRIRHLVKDQTGAALAEYGLLVALIAVVCIAAVTTLGTGVQGALNNAAGAL
jgi:pilus assembly protein Flp/PilA